MSNSTGAVHAYLRNLILFRQELCHWECNPALDLMLQPSVRYSGILLKVAIRKPGTRRRLGSSGIKDHSGLLCKYSLASAEGVSEVASIGGYVKEYQVDIDPDAMKSHGVTVMDIMNAVKNSNLDIGAETVELNKVEYVVTGLGYIKNLDDLRNAVVAVRNNVPVRIRDVAKVVSDLLHVAADSIKAALKLQVLWWWHVMVQIPWKSLIM